MYNIERQRAFNAEVCKANFPPSLRTFVFNFFAGFPALVGLSGLEPPTSRLSGVRSNRLSYRPPLAGVLWPRRLSPLRQINLSLHQGAESFRSLKTEQLSP